MKLLPLVMVFGGIALACSSHGASRLTNVSVRSTAGAGAETLIVGFNLSGSGTKQMLIRGIGPSLASFNVPNVVADPQLRLFNGANAQIDTNDNWENTSPFITAFASVGAFPLLPASRDAALLSRLGPGAYSAHLSSAGQPGVALIEVYDTEGQASAAEISNLSARSVSGAGADVLTIGFSISGDTPKTVLIRAVGPSLTAFGVTGELTNPQLRLFRGTTPIGDNDDWLAMAGWSQTFNAVGAFSLGTGSRDAALLINLPPGSYTAQASGANNATGVALIEIYDVPNPPATSLVLRPVLAPLQPSTPSVPTTDLGRVGTPPVVQTQARPQYPFEMRVAGISGETIIDFIVNTEGRVQDAYILRATDIRFGEAGLAAVRQWTFLPGRVNGQPVNTHMQVPIVFTLTGG